MAGVKKAVGKAVDAHAGRGDRFRSCQRWLRPARARQQGHARHRPLRRQQRAEQGVAHVAVRAAHRPHYVVTYAARSSRRRARRARRAERLPHRDPRRRRSQRRRRRPRLAVVTLDQDAQQARGRSRRPVARRRPHRRRAGRSTGPTKVGRDLRVTAAKPYTSAAGAARAVRELDGGKGLFKDFRVTQHKSLLRTTTEFSGHRRPATGHRLVQRRRARAHARLAARRHARASSPRASARS